MSRVLNYIKYLRDVSRKIITRNGFEKSYLIKANKFATPFQRFRRAITSVDSEYTIFNDYYNQVRSSSEKKLFIGYGLVIGTKQRKLIAGPIVYVQCEIEKDSSTQTITLELSDVANLNYDLIATLSDSGDGDDDNVFTPSTTSQALVLEKLENELANCNTNESLSEFSRQVFRSLKIDFPDFAKISSPQEPIDFKAEINRYLISKVNSVFKGPLKYYPQNFSFVANVPDQLSTYQALHSFVDQIEKQHDFANPVLEKLLTNAFTDEQHEIANKPDSRINQIINEVIPLTLSSSQREAMRNAWEHEISYVQGPPGTGKSHTISAILLSALALNKKVLVVSQKQPALEVVNQKVNPLFSEDTNVNGVIYFDKDSKQKIRQYVRGLLQGNTQDIDHLETNIKAKRAEINRKQSNKNGYRKQLIQNLKLQQEFKELNENFGLEVKRFSRNFSIIPDKRPFQIIRDTESYNNALTIVKRIGIASQKPFSARLFLSKYKQHLIKKFDFPHAWLNQNDFLLLSEKYIHLNAHYSEAEKVKRQITTDETTLRRLIKDLDDDMTRLKSALIKMEFKHRLLKNLRQQSIVGDLDNFERMLHWTNSKMVMQRMSQIDFNNITSVFPFWTAEIRNIGQVFPLEAGLFDLIIVDEASQVNLAEILPVFYRGKNICIVGDHKQLNLKATGLSFGLTDNFDERIWNKYNGNYLSYKDAQERNLIVKKSSILDFIRSPHYSVRIKEVMLEEHFRSLPQLARYTSKSFYKDEHNPDNTDGRLKIMTETPDKIALQCFKGVFVNGKRDSEHNNKFNIKEADTTIELIKFLTATESSPNLFSSQRFDFPAHINRNAFTIGVISIIRDQCSLIQEKLNDTIGDEVIEKYKIMVGTPEEFQGSERDINHLYVVPG